MYKPLTLMLMCLAASTVFADDAELKRHFDQITAGVDSINSSPGTEPGTILPAGENTFPIAWGKQHQILIPVVCGAVCGKGRAVAFSHSGFLSPEALKIGETARLVKQSLVWLSGSAATEPLPVAIDRKFSAALKGLPGIEGLKITKLDSPRDLNKLPAGTVYVTYPDDWSPAEIEPVREFIANGGGVLATCVGWGWAQVTRKSLITENSFNRLFGPFGLYTNDDSSDRINAKGYPISGVIPPAMRICDALRIAESGEKVDTAAANRAFWGIGALQRVLPPEEREMRERIENLCKIDPSAIPSPKSPFTGQMIRERLALSMFQDRWLRDPYRVWPAHPAATTYPGLPPEGAPRVTRNLTVDMKVPRWHSTGLFAVAGEPITVTLPEGAEKLGLNLRIGTTTCRVTAHPRWVRAPVVDLELPLKSVSTTLSSPFGGLVYIVVPNGRDGEIKVKIGPACPAPWFKLGRDTPQSWRDKIRQYPAPMAEIECEQVVLAVPANEIRGLDDPTPLLKVWKEVLDLDAKLTGISPNRASPERYSGDVQLCAGYMHAGYPIMYPNDTAIILVNVDTIRNSKAEQVWGFFHEMGHNHQNSDWTFDGTGEVTVNLFTLYCMEKVCGLKPRQTRMGSQGIQKSVKKWMDEGRSFEKWKSDPFMALELYVRLIEKYGWETFEKTFAEYRTLPNSERPKNDLEKRSQFVKRFSKYAGEDIGPLFKEWNIPY